MEGATIHKPPSTSLEAIICFAPDQIFPKTRILYKYNVLERVLVENIIPRNVIINPGASEVYNHISRDDFSTSTLSRMLYLFYYTEHYSFIFLPWCEKFQRQRNV